MDSATSMKNIKFKDVFEMMMEIIVLLRFVQLRDDRLNHVEMVSAMKMLKV